MSTNNNTNNLFGSIEREDDDENLPQREDDTCQYIHVEQEKIRCSHSKQEVAGLMLPVYAANAYLVYFIQPWRRTTVSFGPIRVRNVMNRADVMNFCGQAPVIIIAFALD